MRPPQADFVYRFPAAFLIFRNRVTDSNIRRRRTQPQPINENHKKSCAINK
jgi:hypothetical protein